MAILMFLAAAVIFFLDAAKIFHVDYLWGLFFLALGFCVGGVPWPTTWRRP
jgi:hypothetical protein